MITRISLGKPSTLNSSIFLKKMEGVVERHHCTECGNKYSRIFELGQCKVCYQSNMKKRMAALDDRERLFRQSCRCGKQGARRYALYLCRITRIKFIRSRNEQTLEAARIVRNLVFKCEQLMDEQGVPEDFELVVPDEEVVYMSDVESEPEAEFTDGESDSLSSCLE